MKTLKVHTRCVENRVEIVKGRVYVHPLPQLMDNYAYLVVCLPKNKNTTNSDKKSVHLPIVALVVDCGDATSVKEQVEYLHQLHYSSEYKNNKIEIHSLVSTHKHHDHTAGNGQLIKEYKKTLKRVHGGAVEKVPYCNRPVKNGDFLNLPCVDGNDMNEVATMECIAVPSHTRGSIVYALRPKLQLGGLGDEDSCSEIPTNHLFTGDAIFSGGGGVPFEADMEFPSYKKEANMMSNANLRPTVGMHSTERCFAEVLVRASKNILPAKTNSTSDQNNIMTTNTHNTTIPINQILIYPGHEYTVDLIARQFDRANTYATRWSQMDPSTFFSICSNFFVSNHCRTLPRSNRIPTIPTSIHREIKINPHFRMLKWRGEHVIQALKIWSKYTARSRNTVKSINSNSTMLSNTSTSQRSSASVAIESLSSRTSLIQSLHQDDNNQSDSNISTYNNKESSSSKAPTTWTTSHQSINKPVFTTVYTSDLQNVIESLNNGSITPSEAAYRLSILSAKLDMTPVVRKPIPGTLPGEKSMYNAILGLAILGSKPCALANGDALKMNLPVANNHSDYLKISKWHLIDALKGLGLVMNGNGQSNGEDETIQLIHLLWKESKNVDMDEDENELKDLELFEEGQSFSNTPSHRDKQDEFIELGMLKLNLFSIPLNQKSWLSKLCMPCGGTPRTLSPAKKDKKKQKLVQTNGELIRHDVYSCFICRDTTGCPNCSRREEEDEESLLEKVRLIQQAQKEQQKPFIVNYLGKSPQDMARLLMPGGPLQEDMQQDEIEMAL